LQEGISRQGRQDRKGFKGKTEMQQHPVSLRLCVKKYS
jgi:hypothetical protein